MPLRSIRVAASLPLALAAGLLLGGGGCSSKPAETDTAETIPAGKSGSAATPNPVPTSAESMPPPSTPVEPKP